jgi:hypothetical protein
MRYLKRYESINIDNKLESFLNDIVTLFDKEYYTGKRNQSIYLYNKTGYMSEMISKFIIDDYELAIEIYTREFDINFLLADYLKTIKGIDFIKNYTNHSIVYEYEIFSKEEFLNNLNPNDFKIFIESNKYNL